MKGYFDNNATTPVAPEVIEAITPYFAELYQNPASVSGMAVGLREIVGKARRSLATLLDCSEAADFVFTSGATESNNWAILGVAEAVRKPAHLVTSAIEHPSVLEPLRRLESRGWTLTVIPVGGDGIVHADALAAALREETVFVSIMAANNETGVVQPIAELASVVKTKAPVAIFHTDATQAVGKLRLSLSSEFEAVDLLSLSAHKFHGPKGCGALFIREGTELPPMILGGGQEGGRRSGTTNVPGVVGLGLAAAIANQKADSVLLIAKLRDRFEHRLTKAFPDVVIHGLNSLRLTNTSCFSLPGTDANALADALAIRGVYVGTGSACTSGALHPPHTLLEMGVDYELAASAIRISLNRYTAESELDSLVDELIAERLRNHST